MKRFIGITTTTLVVAMVCMLAGCKKSGHSGKTVEKYGLISAGDAASVDNGGSFCILATTEEAYAELAQAISSRNVAMMDGMVSQRKAFRVGKNTKVNVISIDEKSMYVRVTSGEETGRSGFINREWVQK